MFRSFVSLYGSCDEERIANGTDLYNKDAKLKDKNKSIELGYLLCLALLLSMLPFLTNTNTLQIDWIVSHEIYGLVHEYQKKKKIKNTENYGISLSRDSM